MGQHEAHQKGLLFAGGAARGLRLFGAMTHRKVARLRADEGAPGGGVPAPVGAQQGAVAILHLKGGHGGQHLLDLALQRHLRPGKGRGLVPLGFDEGGEACHGLEARRRDGQSQTRQLLLGGVKPGGVAHALFEQAVAVAQGPLKSVDAGSVVGIDRQHQPVQKAPPVPGRAGKKAIHGGRQPDEAQMVREGPGRADGGAVNAATPGGAAVRRLDARAQLDQIAIALQLKRGRPAARAADAGEIAEVSPSQPAPGGEHGEGFEHIGLARPVLPGERDERRLHLEVEGGIGAEIREREPPHHGAAQGWRGISGQGHGGLEGSPLTRASASAHRARRPRRDPGSRSASRDQPA